METKVILNALRDLLKNLEISDSFRDLDSESPLFYDSCQVIGARLKLRNLIDAIELIDRFSVDVV